jgi:LysM repeat protein
MRPLNFLRSFGLAVCLLTFSLVVSGCFQTAGAALDATITPPGGVMIALAPSTTPTDLPIPTAITPLPTLTPDFIQFPTLTFTPEFPTLTPQPQLQFPVETQTPLPTYTELPTQAPLPTLTGLPTYTALPTYTEVPSQTPLPTYTLPPSQTPLPTYTLPPVITPGRTAVAIAQIPEMTATQDFLNTQAASIYLTATFTTGQNQTAIATALGTFPPPEGGGVPPPPIIIPPTPLPPASTLGYVPVYVTATPVGTPGIPGSNASGVFDSVNCKYYVAQGDTVYGIAKRFNFNPSVTELSRVNRITNPEALSIGAILTIPNCTVLALPTQIIIITPGGPIVPGGGTGATAVPGGPRTHVVREGETLYGIAARYGVSVSVLAQANNITNLNYITINQRLTIP